MSINTIIKVSGALPNAATTNSISSIDIPEDSEIVSIGGLIVTTVAQAAAGLWSAVAELSFLSTNQIGTNDARGAVAGIGVTFEIFGAAAGTKTSEQNALTFPEAIIVSAGERMHLHGITNLVGPGSVATATFLLYLRTKGGGRRRARLR